MRKKSLDSSIVESADEGAMSVLLDGTITNCNTSVAAWFGLKSKSVLGQPIENLSSVLQAKAITGIHDLLADPRCTAVRTYSRRDGNLGLGRMLDIRWTIQRVPGNNPTLAARIETDSDSDYLAAERERFQQEAHQLQLENYVSRIGHEVNNSNFVALSSVTTLADIWAGVLPVLDQYRAENGDFVVSAQNYGDIREEATELFGLLVDAIRRARQTVEDFRDRIPKLDAAIEDRLDATSVLHDALTLLAPVLLRRVGLVSTASYAGVPPICGNRRRLQHILAILLKNAAEATEYATETINVTVEPHKNGTSCVFEFKDTGVGITAEVQTKAFEPFFTTHREQGHLGLGLAIAKCIVIEHGGALELRQREARGTCARLTIPHREQ